MTLSLTHTFVSTTPDGADATVVRPSNWNDTHTIAGTLPIANGGTNSTATPTAGGIGYGTGTAHAYTEAGTTGQVLTSATAGTPTWTTPTTGTVTSVAQTFTGGIISVAGSPITSSGTLALTVAGTSGGVPYFSSGSAWASTAAGTSGQYLKSNGASAPTWADASNPITVGTSTVTSGTSGRVLYDNAGVVGEYAITGTAGSSVLSIAPAITGIATTDLFATNNNAVSVSSNAGTCSQSYELNTFTNSSAATMTITLAVSTPTPKDGQKMIVRIYDFSAAAQTISWVNTENSTVTVPTTSNGSTTLPLTVGFMYNAQTSKWRFVASA